MRLQYRLRESFIWITSVSTVLSVLTSIFYFNCKEYIVWSILNNIMICISTGCIIGCIQSFVGYANEKYMAVLNFYKEAIMLEDAIINYPFMRSGFIKSDEGLKDIRVIIHRYLDSFKFSSQCVFIGKHPDEVLKAANSLYISYGEQIKPFREMDDAIIDSLRFMDKSDSELISEGIDIQSETERINTQLQSLEHKIELAYNARLQQEQRIKNYEVLEAYLFSKKGEKKNEV